MKVHQIKMGTTGHQKIRALHVIHTLNLGGAESNLYNLVAAHDLACVEPHVAYASGGPYEEKLRKKDVRLFKYTDKSTKVKSVGSIKIILSLVTYIKQNRIQVVHTHNYNAHVWGSLAAKLTGVKIVEHVHDPRYEPAELFKSRGLVHTNQFKQARFFAGLSDRILVLTQTNRDFLLNKCWKAPENVSLIPNGIPLGNEEQTIAPLSPKPAGKSVIFAAMRLSLEKNAGFILSIAKNMPHEDVVFWIAGDGPDKEKIEQQIINEELQSRVKLLGLRSDIRALLGSSDIFILPTLRELHSLTVLEAMSCGVPVLVSKGTGCNDDFISDGTNGFLLDPHDADKWAEKISYLLDHPDETKHIGEAGRSLVESQCDIRQTVRKIEDIYKELAN